MPTYKKISGKHFYRDENGKLLCVKEGETIKCPSKLLGGSISTFKRIKDDEDTESLPSEPEEVDTIEEKSSEEVEKPKKKVKKEKSKKEEIKTFKRKADKDD